MASLLSLLGCVFQKQGPDVPYKDERYHHVTCEGGMKLDGSADRMEGERVVAYLDVIATDTDYSFYVEGVEFDDVDYGSQGYEVSFVMPGNDVTVGYTMRNSMEYVPDGREAE